MASYVLSEDETSKSADEFDVPIAEDNTDCSISSRAPNRCRHKGTAKVVSFIFAGKPQLVDMASCDGLTSLRRRRTDCSEETWYCFTPLRLIPSTTKPLSISTPTVSVSPSSTKLPLLECTNLTANAPNVSVTSTQLFLQSDRFPTDYTQEVRIVSLPDMVAKVPTTIAEKAWSSRMNSILRTLSKMVTAIRIKARG
jgi:hypothetical protein